MSLSVNGRRYEVDIDSRLLLVHLIRDEIGLTGTHLGCVTGKCGACTVLYNGDPVKSCMMYGVQADGSEIMTVEGLSQGEKLHPLQEAFREKDALECGYCTPGMLVNAYALLEKNSSPTEDEIRKHMVGNLCRCTGYLNIVSAIQSAAKNKRESNDD